MIERHLDFGVRVRHTQPWVFRKIAWIRTETL